MEKLIMVMVGLLAEKMEYGSGIEVGVLEAKLSKVEVVEFSFEELKKLVEVFEAVCMAGHVFFSVGAYEVYFYAGLEALEKYLMAVVSAYSYEYEYV